MDRPDPIASAAPWVELGFRIATSLIFIVAGIGHLVRPEQMLARLAEAPLGAHLVAAGLGGLLVLGTGVVLLLGGLALAFGLRTRPAALALVAVLVPITVTAHVGHGGDPGPLLKNVALLGSLAHFAVAGAGRFAVDRDRR